MELSVTSLRVLRNIFRMHGYIVLLSFFFCIFYGSAVKFDGFQAIRTARYVRTSCPQILNIRNKDLSGSDITDNDWETYEPRPYKDSYVTYNYTDFQLCLKFVPDSVRYTQARAHCDAEGGDLIRIDTTLKFNIFKDMLAPFANFTDIEVWILAMKMEQIWRFHDGFLVPHVFPTYMSNDIGEIYLRAKSDYNFMSLDIFHNYTSSYLCEYYRQFQRSIYI